jgi:tRNA nucleotidyltransferase (CCA-adding enzyme)
MADYIYLLESRLSQAQQRAILAVREIARSKGLTVFLVGGAVRDLTSGSPVRDLDVVVQGNALKLQKYIEKAGGMIAGENEAGQSLFVSFPGGVRMEIGSTLSVVYPKPGKPVVRAANLLDDLRRRDFTANAMALSLNEGSYGLLMDPLNGVADIENRELRLVSNYGFIEDPVRMIRAARYAARLGWTMEEKTKARYETGKSEGYISAMSSFQRGYEMEEIAHEEDPLRVMRGLEHEGWMKLLTPVWTSSKANVAELEKLRDAQAQLQTRGIIADASAAQFPLLTAKLAPKDVSTLKRSFPRQGFVNEIDALEGEGKKFAAEFSAKQAATPSVAWKMLLGARPEAVLWAAYSSGKNAGMQAKFKGFYTEWPQARQRIPYVQMQEMRIIPTLAGYDELVEKIFFELMDGKLGTPEEMKAFLEPYSPPAPPPPVHLRRARVAKKEPKVPKSRKKAVAVDGGSEDAAASSDAVATDVATADAPLKGSAQKPKGSDAGKVSAATKSAVAPVKAAAKVIAPAKKAVAVKASAVKPSPVKAAAKKAAPVKKAVVKAVAKKVVAKRVVAKPVAKKLAKPATKKVMVKPKAKSGGKSPAKTSKKPAPKVVTKAAKKPAKKVAAKKMGKNKR